MESAPNTVCPVCLVPIVASRAPVFPCPACGTKFECLFAAPTVPAKIDASLGSCAHHAEAPATTRCRKCRSALCAICTFRFQGMPYCADCVSSPVEDLQRATAKHGVTSVVLSILAFLALVGLAAGAVSMGNSVKTEIFGMAVGAVVLILSVGGLALGFMSRDPARGRSPAGLAGIILGFLVLGLYVLLILIAIATG